METVNEHLHDVKQQAWHFTSNVCYNPGKCTGSVDGHGFTEEHTGSTGLRLGSANHVDVAGVGRG